jgi:hypothetical protein
MAVHVVEHEAVTTIRPAAAELWAHRVVDYHVSWTALVIGALTALSAMLAFGLVASAFGAHQAGADGDAINWTALGIGALGFAVFTAFFAYVIGGWVAGRLAGGGTQIGAAHGAMSWLVSVPLMLVLLAIGAGSSFGALTAGLGPRDRMASEPAARTEAEEAVQRGIETIANPTNQPNTPPIDPDAAAAARNAALTALALMILGITGSWLGGRMAGAQLESVLQREQPAS